MSGTHSIISNKISLVFGSEISLKDFSFSQLIIAVKNLFVTEGIPDSKPDPRNAYIDARYIRSAINDFLAWYRLNESTTHPMVLAAISYRWIVSIHPFGNGNGRTARLVMDWILQKNGFPPSVIAPGEHVAASFGRHSPESEESRSVSQENIVAAVIKGLFISSNLMSKSLAVKGTP